MRGTALITGAAHRIGRVLALTAAEAGYDVAVHHRGPANDAEKVAAEIRALGRKAAPVAAELADEAQTSTLVRRAADTLGPVTLLINNASVFQDDRLQSHTRASWDAHIETNLRAPVLLAQAFAAELPQDREGLIVNLLDQRVWNPNPQFFSYGLSRAALWSATQVMAQALAPRIRVNGIGPGPTLPSIHQTAGQFEAEAHNIPLQRRSSPEDVAAALRYLIDARQVTGQMIAVDGGQHLAWKTPDVVGDLETGMAEHSSVPHRPGQLTGVKVFVRGLKLEAEIGVYDHEHGRRQPLLADVEMDVIATGRDRLAETVNYEVIAEKARRTAAEGHFQLVEAFAERLGQLCLEDERVTRVRVRVEKPLALAPEAAAAGAEITLARL